MRFNAPVVMSAVPSEMVVLATEGRRRAQLAAAAASRKAGGKKGAKGAADLLGPAAAQGSMYHSADLKHRGGGGGGGPVETSFNPLSLGAAGSAGASGRSLAGAGGALDVAESIAGMAAPPPPEVWRVVQAAFLQLHSQSVEDRLRVAALSAGGSATPDPRFGDGGDASSGWSASPSRRAFAPTVAAASSNEDEAEVVAPASAAAALRAFRSSSSAMTGRSSRGSTPR